MARRPVHAILPAMSAKLHQPMTPAAFLAWEERQELRREFDGFAPVAMTGGWLGRLLGPADTLAMPEIGTSLPLTALYARDRPAGAAGRRHLIAQQQAERA